ncbi:MAG: FHA domain-containing protein [Aggregatilineales bacterium]
MASNQEDETRPNNIPEPEQPDDAALDDGEEFSDDDLSKAYTTLIISGKKRRVLREKAAETGMLPKDHRELILVIRGMVERVPVPTNNSILLGRMDPKASPYAQRPDVDLTPYGALERGVSRIHARLDLDGDDLFLTDLDSTNGTFLADKRLEPEVSTPLQTGNEFLLGRLALQVLFR